MFAPSRLPLGNFNSTFLISGASRPAAHSRSIFLSGFESLVNPTVVLNGGGKERPAFRGAARETLRSIQITGQPHCARTDIRFSRASDCKPPIRQNAHSRARRASGPAIVMTAHPCSASQLSFPPTGMDRDQCRLRVWRIYWSSGGMNPGTERSGKHHPPQTSLSLSGDAALLSMHRRRELGTAWRISARVVALSFTLAEGVEQPKVYVTGRLTGRSETA